jgi:hypothetical protein
MNLLDVILNANDGSTVSQLGSQFGLKESQAASAIQSLLPALAGGLQRNISQGGLTDLLGALTSGRHQQYLDDPSALGSPAVREDGNKILGHILGSKDVSRKVAAQASTRTGIDESVLKQMLPAVASMAMGALSRQTSSSSTLPGASAPAATPGGGSGILGLLTPLLDQDRDGSVVDDVLGSVSRLFQK